MNGNLVTALDRRVKSVVSDNSLSVLQVFDAAALVSLHCGSSSDGVVKLVVQDGEYETYGVEACGSCIKSCVKDGTHPEIWNGFRPTPSIPLHVSSERGCQGGYLGQIMTRLVHSARD